MRDQKEIFVHDDPVVDAALEWFARLRNIEPDQDSLQEFRDWLDQDPRHEKEFLALERMWSSPSFLSAVRSLENVSVSKSRLQVRLRASPWSIQLGAIAASLLLAAGIWQAPEIMSSWQADYRTATGAQSVVSLPDGSTMLLNTDSAVAIDFEHGRRNVRLLRGEAFFDVVHDLSRPFRVAGTYGEVEVKGTAFSVRTDDEHTDVVLERGLVEVTCLCQAGGGVQLHPGQAVTASADALSTVSTIDATRALAWKDGRISFDNVQLAEVLAELARYYSGRIFVADSRVGHLRVSGNYRLDNIEGAIRTLADASGVEMTRIPGGFIILR
jgi:transmembrane sensor